MPCSIQLRSVAPAPISMSSEWAPKAEHRQPIASGRRSEVPSRVHRGGDLWSAARLPWHVAAFDHFLEHLPVSERVHGSPESFILVCHELAALDEALEGLIDQLLSFADVVEYLVAENEVPAVDPDLGLLIRRASGAPCPCSSNSARWKVSGGWTAMKQPILPLFLKRSIISGSGASVRPSL